ncbi:unnamed protein product [Blepharisma stoltei]|uniref:Dickkopf N-terminal cysteine-rich domain-containing protein n=1 Tax=Blepharisma stoltei TaxID=1481888 RepID=A0AAU9JL13_9CILI|nr:unnamed protein product [Blepharisma stoltei]
METSKLALLAFSVIFSLSAAAPEKLKNNQCPLYQCKQDHQNFVDNTCVFYTPTVTQPTYYVTSCSKRNPHCQAPVQRNSTCEGNPPSPPVNAWPGEKCSSSSQCSNHAKNGCVNSVCVGSLNGEACFTSDDCNPGLRCFNQQCVPQIHIGGTGCTSDYDCVNGSGCNLASTPANSICFPYFSISNHLPVGYCSPTNSSMLCNSGLCMEYDGVYECMSQVSTAKKIPQQCSVDADCMSTRDDYFEYGQLMGSCLCGYNPSGNSYCTLFPGDEPAKQSSQYLIQWIQSSSINNCNTMRRFTGQCMSDWWNSKLNRAWNYFSLNAIYYPQLQGALDCVQPVFLAPWYQAKEAY